MANILIFHDGPGYEEALNTKGHKILSFSDKTLPWNLPRRINGTWLW